MVNNMKPTNPDNGTKIGINESNIGHINPDNAALIERANDWLENWSAIDAGGNLGNARVIIRDLLEALTLPIQADCGEAQLRPEGLQYTLPCDLLSEGFTIDCKGYSQVLVLPPTPTCSEQQIELKGTLELTLGDLPLVVKNCSDYKEIHIKKAINQDSQGGVILSQLKPRNER